MKQFLTSVAKWSWFALLMLIAFGYMASGLSDRSGGDRRGEMEATETGLAGPGHQSAPPATDAGETVESRTNDSPQTLSLSESKATQSSLEEVVNAVNRARENQLSELGLQSAEPADWLTTCRRASLGI